MNTQKASKFLSLLLRHKPETIGLTLDPQGWAKVDDLVRLSNQYSRALSRELIHEVVRSSDKQRFTFSEDNSKIRANQGHSIPVELELKAVKPPAKLFHGSATRFADSILAQGLLKQKRMHVHLSTDLETASAVGIRYGKLIMLEVDSSAMFSDGYTFFVSKNGVWLTDHVPPSYIRQL